MAIRHNRGVEVRPVYSAGFRRELQYYEVHWPNGVTEEVPPEVFKEEFSEQEAVKSVAVRGRGGGTPPRT